MSTCLTLKKSNCKNCYKCIRHCPVKSIRFSGNQAHIIGNECILCGQCFVVCPQNAKEITSEVEKVKVLLASGDPVYVSLAPSFVANYDGVGIGAMRRALQKLGFTDAEETAVGATMVKREYERMLAEEEHDIIITSCCHSVNLLIQKYFPTELQYLAKVLSPMQAHCTDIKRRHPNAKTVFIGPCVAKKDEAEYYEGIVDAVLTFEELTEWLAAVLLAGIIVGAIFIIKGCKKDDAPADDAQNTNQPVDNVGDTTTPDNVIVDDELLTLVNPWNPLPDDWTVDLVTLDDGHRVDSRCYEAYMEMINACKAAGYSPVNCSSYRAQETQQSLYDNKVQRLISSGMSEDEAKAEAAKAVAIPGTSEHQLGLAVDLVDANMQDLTSAQESTETQKWLMANSWRYGFIHRYPNGKTDITGIIYEPWHYRYVGKDAAQEIFNRDITLEEYLGKTEH